MGVAEAGEAEMGKAEVGRQVTEKVAEIGKGSRGGVVMGKAAGRADG